MVYPYNMSDRPDNARPRDSMNGSIDESSYAPTSFFDGPTSPNSSRPTSQRQSLNVDDLRSSLTRRNTTNGFPSLLPSNLALSPMGQQRRQAAEQAGFDYSFPSLQGSSQVLAKKEAEYEYIKRKRQQFEEEMARLDEQERRLNQSEPPTPQELATRKNAGFPTPLSRPNRFSSSSIISPPTHSSRPSRAGSQAISPPESGRDLAYQTLMGLSAQSLAPTRLESDENDDHYEYEVLNFDHRKAASLNRNSMPVTRRDHTGHQDINESFSFVNTTGFLGLGDKEDDLEARPLQHRATLPPTFYQMHTNDDGFPVLGRRDTNHSVELSSVSDALDLALSQTPDPEQNNGGWPTFARKVGSFSSVHSPTDSPASNNLPPPSSSGSGTPSKTAPVNRHSMGARIGTYSSDIKRPGLFTTPPTSSAVKPHSSFSTSSVPTITSINSSTSTPKSAANATAEQRLHNHNLSLGRIPSGALTNNRQSRDFAPASPEPVRAEENSINMQSLQSVLQANAAPFGPPSLSSAFSPETQSATAVLPMPTSAPGYNTQQFSYNGGFGTAPPGVAALTSAMDKMQVVGNGHTQVMPPPVQSHQQSQYLGYNQFPGNYAPSVAGGNRLLDNQSRVKPQRRGGAYGEETSKYAGVELERLQGEIYALCRDQHGCRYLQKKLEERKPEYIDMIFNEVNEYMVELMTDPFGNYLCQKLLEYTNDEQRTTLINNAAPDMVSIALNQHGTRALQKMIEFVSTPTQIQVVIIALQNSVVTMIQDLNGNHVIQKCLNRLSSKDAQFIFDAVANNCVPVGTHRHGCCVIQRCVDHASGNQKNQLVQAITDCSMDLVQDPFGNYVLQYIFDLNEESFSQPMCKTFLGNVARLAKQKFSSNVIEKCIRIAASETRHAMVQEMINYADFEKLADDPFANYVVQTAWDYADTEDEAQLAEKIRPVLPRMRHKPYGRRFQNKVAERDKKLGINQSGSLTPSDVSSPDGSVHATPFGRGQEPSAAPNVNGMGQMAGMNGAQGMMGGMASMMNGGYGSNGFVSPQYGFQAPSYGFGTGRMSNPPFPNANVMNGQYQQGHVQQPNPQTFIPFGRQQNGRPNYY